MHRLKDNKDKTSSLWNHFKLQNTNDTYEPKIWVVIRVSAPMTLGLLEYISQTRKFHLSPIVLCLKEMFHLKISLLTAEAGYKRGPFSVYLVMLRYAFALVCSILHLRPQASEITLLLENPTEQYIFSCHDPCIPIPKTCMQLG